MKFDINGWLDIAQEYDILGNSWDRGGIQPTHLVIHGTAGGSNGADVAAYMKSAGVSTHFIISTDGTIWQCIPCNSAAWANAPLKSPRINFTQANINPNLWTISIEFCKPDTTNKINITNAQKVSGFMLIKFICESYNIPKRAGDGNSGIISHADINSVDRAQCPGTFPWNELWIFLQGENYMLPTGWKDDGHTITIPGCQFVITGWAREYVLAHQWNDIPVENIVTDLPQLELSNPKLGGGDRQRFNNLTLERTKDGHVFQAYTGPELLLMESLLKQSLADKQQLHAQIAQLQAAPKTVIAIPEETKAEIINLAQSMNALVKQAQ